MSEETHNTQDELKKRFMALPKVIQDAMLDAHIEERLRGVAKKYKLHYDKWVVLENEIMLTLLNMQSPEDLPQHIMDATGLKSEDAHELTDTIVRDIYNPIQEKLYDELNNKKERAVKVLLKQEDQINPPEPDEVYHKTTLKSTERKETESDPYRENIFDDDENASLGPVM